jgi:beta-lactamase superfamily II metal-dependent hydrolase
MMGVNSGSQSSGIDSLRLRVIQAEYGDCLILEADSGGKTSYILIDGGPDGVYSNYLRPELQKIAGLNGSLDLVVLTHVDEDHVVGLVDMLSDIGQARNRDQPPVIGVSELWYNTFRPIDSSTDGSSDLVDTLSAYLSSSFAGGEMQGVAYSISQGEDLWKAARILNIPLNSAFTTRVVALENAPRPVELAGLKFWVIGPPQANLARFKRDWDKWFSKHKNDPYSTDAVSEARNLDTSVSNLSSIMFLVETPGRRILLTGDGKCDDVLAGLKRVGLSGPDGRIHVDVLKVPHHGSARNSSRKFFKNVTASQYVIPAGKHKNDNNPDLQTLVWMVESAKQRGEHIDILVTNPNDNTTELQQKYPDSEYGYTLAFLDTDQISIVI